MLTLSGSMRRRLLAGLLVALPLLPVAAQTKSTAKKTLAKTAVSSAPAAASETVYELYQVQIKPEYAAGQFALQQYLKDVRLPAEVREGRVGGTVYVSFVVRPDGRLTDTFVTRGLSAATNAEALRLVQAMPRWRPGRRNEEAVATRYALGVQFLHATEEKTATVTVRQPTDLSGPEGEGNRVVEEVVEQKVYQYVEQMPVFPGGTQTMLNYIQGNLKYPPQARQQQVEGKVFLSFTVGTNGNVGDVKVQKGIGAGCDEEAVRVVKSMPAWTPGKQNGRTVAVSYTVPVTFSLSTAKPETSVTATLAPIPAPPEDKVYTYVEQMPSAPGGSGTSGIAKAIQAALVLPTEVREGQREGQVYVYFVVRPDGSVSDAKVSRPLSPTCDEAALAAVRKLTNLEPGKQNGRAVSVQLTMPVMLYGPHHVFEAHQVATQATFPGGGEALRQYLTDKLREPKVLKQQNLVGTVQIRYVVQADGRIGATEVVRSLCRSCDDEALRLVRDMPRWAPAFDGTGQPVSVRQTILITMPAPVIPRSTGKAHHDKASLLKVNHA